MKTSILAAAVVGPARVRIALCGAMVVLLLPIIVAAQTAEPLAYKVVAPEQPAVLVVRGATVWTSGPQGVLEGADLLVRAGKIERVGRGLGAPNNAVVVEAAGKHVTAGLIDAHSHTTIDGSVNEFGNNVTAEVGIEDVVSATTANIYRQLAGGKTLGNELHGSSNAIGGRNAIVKYRWGAPPKDLLMKGAPPGIKFALGENPRGSNDNGANASQQFPQTRSGVERLIRERFGAALDYRLAQQAAAGAKGGATIGPKPDLQLEAILEILDGQRLVHAHSYRADEVLMLLRLCDEYGIKIASLQHILEGYKVADEIAAHGAGASTFSDWWAYKYEVIDAIPWNGAIMRDRGVVVSFNSDDDELARRLNLEAAKAVRYGGVPPEEALNFVTINPAKQLHIADRVGSLERGKDADFVIWSGSPLSVYSVVEQTWVDGRKYFDRAEDLARRDVWQEERRALLAKVLASAKKDEDEKKSEQEGGEAKAEGGVVGEEPEIKAPAKQVPEEEPPLVAVALRRLFQSAGGVR